MIINGSPRAPKSNSRRYAEIFARYCPVETDYFNLTKRNHRELCELMGRYTDVLFVFPLYADALPVGFLEFLKVLVYPERDCHADAAVLLPEERVPVGGGLGAGQRRGHLGDSFQICGGAGYQAVGPVGRPWGVLYDTGHHAAEQAVVHLGLDLLLDPLRPQVWGDSIADADSAD